MASSVISSAVTCLLSMMLIIGMIHQDSSVQAQKMLSNACFGCLCEATSGCNQSAVCVDDVCGPFRITRNYWIDGGKPVLENQPDTGDGYFECVTDVYCAARAVSGYMDKYGKDCNGDGIVNCNDYMRIHRLGPNACSSSLPLKYQQTYELCVQMFPN